MTTETEQSPYTKTGPGAGIRYFYFTLRKTKTAVAFVLDDNRESNNRTLQCAFAFCRPTDRYLKSRGRDIATGRFVKHPLTLSVQVDPTLTDKDGNAIPVMDQIKKAVRKQVKKHHRLEEWAKAQIA